MKYVEITPNTQRLISTPALSPPQKSFFSTSHQGRLFKKVCEAMYGALSITDAEGIVLYANPSFCALYGVKKEKIIGESFTQILPLKNRDHALKHYKKVYNQDHMKNPFSTSVQMKNGDIKYVEITNDFIFKRRKKAAMISVVRDVTPRVLAERKKDE